MTSDEKEIKEPLDQRYPIAGWIGNGLLGFLIGRGLSEILVLHRPGAGVYSLVLASLLVVYMILVKRYQDRCRRRRKAAFDGWANTLREWTSYIEQRQLLIDGEKKRLASEGIFIKGWNDDHV